MNTDTVKDDMDLRGLLDEINSILATMSKKERIEWFRGTSYPHPINFNKEINGTIHTVNAHFNKNASESLQEKAERILLNDCIIK